MNSCKKIKQFPNVITPALSYLSMRQLCGARARPVITLTMVRDF